MGFLDKLRAVVNTTQSSNDPLADATVKNYYEMIYGMRMSLVAGGAEDNNNRAKNYIEFYLGAPCDEEKLQKAVELFNMSRTDYPKTKTEIALKDMNKRLKEAKTYRCSKVKAFDICYKEIIDDTVSELSKVLDVIKGNPTEELFNQGLGKMLEKSKGTPVYSDWDQFLYNAIQKCFFAENETMKEIIFQQFRGVMEEKIHADAPKYLGAVALRALNFEKHSKNEGEYESFPDSECREYISTFKPFVSYLEKHPFDKEEYIEIFVKQIRNMPILSMSWKSELSDSWLTKCMVACADDYLVDAVCYQFWTEVKTQCGDEINTIGDMVNKMYNFALNSSSR